MTNVWLGVSSAWAESCPAKAMAMAIAAAADKMAVRFMVGVPGDAVLNEPA
jgi:hypothetical protein